MPSLADIAADLATRFPVFPCNGKKHPIVSGGFKAATTDRERVRKLFSQAGAALIGMPTGAVSGIVAIDVDVKNGAPGDKWLQEYADALPPTRTHRTRSGGLHLLFRSPEGVVIGNSTGRIAPGVDVRGEGGYIIVPPSPGYQVADDTEPADMPVWLIKRCLRPETPPAPPVPPRPPRQDGGTPYGLKALDGECEAIRRAPFGAQEETINAAALKIGSLVAAGHLEEGVALAELLAAAQSVPSQPGREPWTLRELTEKIQRGFRDGLVKPRANAPNPDAPRPERPLQRQATPAGAAPNGGATHLKDGSAPLPLIWFDEIEPATDAKDFVQGLLIEGSAIVVYGESNAGKTFWTTDLALHVAAGKPWFDRRVEQGGVIYCVLEGGIGFRNRVAAWRKEHGYDIDSRIPFAAIPSSLNLLEPEADTPRLIATIKEAQKRMEMPVKLVVIDTLARAFAGGNENASEDMGALVRNMDLIRSETGAAILFVHHSGKDQAKGARGHSSLRAAIDTEIEVKADEEAGAKTATIVKQREMKKGDVFSFTLEVVKLGENRHGEPVTTCVVRPGEEGAGTPKRGAKLSLDQQLAYSILCDLIAECGAAGYPGTPAGTVSVAEQWWRDRFYQRAKPGAAQEAKRKAFGRASDALLALRKVAMDHGRVWIP